MNWQIVLNSSQSRKQFPGNLSTRKLSILKQVVLTPEKHGYGTCDKSASKYGSGTSKYPMYRRFHFMLQNLAFFDFIEQPSVLILCRPLPCLCIMSLNCKNLAAMIFFALSYAISCGHYNLVVSKLETPQFFAIEVIKRTFCSVSPF